MVRLSPKLVTLSDSYMYWRLDFALLRAYVLKWSVSLHHPTKSVSISSVQTINNVLILLCFKNLTWYLLQTEANLIMKVLCLSLKKIWPLKWCTITLTLSYWRILFLPLVSYTAMFGTFWFWSLKRSYQALHIHGDIQHFFQS